MNPKLIICTPLYGNPESSTVSWGYHEAMMRLCRDPSVSSIAARFVVNCDLVRSRSRAVRIFLEGDGTHLLFWDEDVVPRDVTVISHMVQADRDIIALPYPRKKLDFDLIADNVRDEEEQARDGRQVAADLEGSGLEWPISMLDKPTDAMARAAHVGIGFTLIKREALERMVAHYKDELTYFEAADGGAPTVALFQLLLDGGALMSEDYSFFHRWRAIGGELWVIGDPARHVGSYAFGRTLVP